jgi:hypothetical protein
VRSAESRKEIVESHFASALARSDPTLLSKTDPGGLWLILERQVTLLQMAIAEG